MVFCDKLNNFSMPKFDNQRTFLKSSYGFPLKKQAPMHVSQSELCRNQNIARKHAIG